MDEERISRKYHELTKILIARSLTITTMESCSGGLIASLITDTEGSSAVFKGAFITYSNEAKIMIGVPERIIEDCGVYSRETASAMAETARRIYAADLAIGVTGTFGNLDPDNPDSILNEVYFAISDDKRTASYHQHLPSCNSRLAYKYCMAELIVDALFTDFLGVEV